MIVARPSAFSLVVAASLALQTAAIPAEAKSSKEHLKIGLISFQDTSTNPHRIARAAMKNCDERGWTCELFDAKGDAVALSNGGLNFVSRGVDGILNIASDNTTLTPVIKAAGKAGIPYVSLYAGDAPGITTDVAASGIVQGALVGDEIRSSINLSGRVIYINWDGLPLLRERERGVRATMAEDKNIQIDGMTVQVQGYMEDAYNKLLAALRANSDVKAVVMGWAELTPGAVRAVQQLGLQDKVKIYSFDEIPEGLDLIRKGSPLAMLVGFGIDDAAVTGLQAIGDTVDGHPPERHALMTRSCLITKENVPAAGAEVDYRSCTPFTAEFSSVK